MDAGTNSGNGASRGGNCRLLIKRRLIRPLGNAFKEGKRRAWSIRRALNGILGLGTIAGWDVNVEQKKTKWEIPCDKDQMSREVV